MTELREAIKDGNDTKIAELTGKVLPDAERIGKGLGAGAGEEGKEEEVAGDIADYCRARVMTMTMTVPLALRSSRCCRNGLQFDVNIMSRRYNFIHCSIFQWQNDS